MIKIEENSKETPDNYGSNFSRISLRKKILLEKKKNYNKKIEDVNDKNEKTPENIALKIGKTQFSYALLNKTANQLARKLIEKGVKKIVWLCCYLKINKKW